MSATLNTFQIQLNSNLPDALQGYVATGPHQPPFPTDVAFYNTVTSATEMKPQGYLWFLNYFVPYDTVVTSVQWLGAPAFGPPTCDLSVVNGFAIYRQTNGDLELVGKTDPNIDFFCSTEGEYGVPRIRTVLFPEPIALTAGRYYLGLGIKMTEPIEGLAFETCRNVASFTPPVININNQLYSTQLYLIWTAALPADFPQTINIETELAELTEMSETWYLTIV